MHYLELFLGFSFILLFLIFSALYLLSIINSFIYKVPQVATFSSDFKVMKKYLGKYNLRGKKIVDLGSGTGRALRFFEKEFNMKTTGYEIDLANVLIAKTLNKICGNKGIFSVDNYLKKDLKEFDFIYVYLFPKLIDKIEKKIWTESNNGTIIISNAFKFKNKSPIDILKDDKGKEEIFIYKVNLQ